MNYALNMRYIQFFLLSSNSTSVMLVHVDTGNKFLPSKSIFIHY